VWKKSLESLLSFVFLSRTHWPGAAVVSSDITMISESLDVVCIKIEKSRRDVTHAGYQRSTSGGFQLPGF
jgi:hypothetical protein